MGPFNHVHTPVTNVNFPFGPCDQLVCIRDAANVTVTMANGTTWVQSSWTAGTKYELRAAKVAFDVGGEFLALKL